MAKNNNSHKSKPPKWKDKDPRLISSLPVYHLESPWLCLMKSEGSLPNPNPPKATVHRVAKYRLLSLTTILLRTPIDQRLKLSTSSM